MTTFVKFRYDFVDDEQHPYAVMHRLFKEFPTGILGIEKYNKYGETIKRHMHLHFVTSEKIETIRRRFLRSAVEGQRDCYSLKEEKDVEDINRFFRYPLKQIENQFVYEYSRIPIPDDFDMELQRHLANEEWERGKQILTKQRVKADSRQSTYEKILDKLEENPRTFADLYEVKNYVLDHFFETRIPPDHHKINNIADGIALLNNVISRYEYFNR